MDTKTVQELFCIDSDDYQMYTIAGEISSDQIRLSHNWQ